MDNTDRNYIASSIVSLNVSGMLSNAKGGMACALRNADGEDAELRLYLNRENGFFYLFEPASKRPQPEPGPARLILRVVKGETPVSFGDMFLEYENGERQSLRRVPEKDFSPFAREVLKTSLEKYRQEVQNHNLELQKRKAQQEKPARETVFRRLWRALAAYSPV